GENGRVFAFEFEPANLSLLQSNLALNSRLASRVTLVPSPVWRTSGELVIASAAGPASGITSGPGGGIATVSIDDFVRERSLPRVDFIKMDIEGAETAALEGAARTIVSHRPRLAISIYHSLQDLIELPAWLMRLSEKHGLDYEFFIDHFTIHHEET